MSPEEAIDLIRQSGGVPVLAHPMLTQRDEIIPRLVRAGLQGLEVYYANCSDAVIHYYEKLARKHKLVMTGGSDAHGDAKSYTWVGKVKVPYTIVDELRERAELLKTS
jgi:predicted metal-dependent phosphoesterase TrpH